MEHPAMQRMASTIKNYSAPPMVNHVKVDNACSKSWILRPRERGSPWFWLAACVTLEMSLFLLVKEDTWINWCSRDFPAQGTEVASVISVGSGLAHGLSLQRRHWSEMIAPEMTHTGGLFPAWNTVCPFDEFRNPFPAGLTPDTWVNWKLILEGC